MELDESTTEWFETLSAFVERRRDGGTSDPAEHLTPLQDEQRRVTGGALMQFLNFIQTEASFELFPDLGDSPISDRIFVFATDEPGMAAAGDLIDRSSSRAIVVSDAEWRAWLSDDSTDADPRFQYHYEYWSAWHRNLRANWDVEELDDGEWWVHEEGFALADRTGRGSRHLWHWDGDSLELEAEDVDSWSSGLDRG